jgi:NCAIR mutase (PurE)-related protein
MKKSLFIFFVLITISSCKEPVIIDNNNQFKTGVFEIPAGKGYSKTIVTRIDSLQIEEYTKTISISTDSIVKERIEKHIDTLYIEWKNNFSYILRMKSPKTSLDKDQIFVKINKVTDSSYSFTAQIGFSKFKQTGTVYKAKQ